MLKIISYISILLALGCASQPPRDPAGTPRKVSSSAASLEAMGFSTPVAAKIAASSPQFIDKLDAMIRSCPAHLEASTKELGPAKKIVTVYRGVNLRKNEKFDPNYNLFQKTDAGELAGAIYVTPIRSIAEGYAKSRTSGKSFIITYEVAVIMLPPGRLDDSYTIRTDTLIDLGIKDVSVFQSGIEAIK